ncbi:MAG: ABC transporter permease [bacterium]
MRFSAYAKTALIVLKANLSRSLLTVLGIVIGVAAVVLVSAVGKGAQSLIVSQVSSLGTNLIGVMPGKTDIGAPAAALGITVTTLTGDDVAALKNLPGVVAATGYVSAYAPYISESGNYDASLMGVSASYLEVEDVEIAEGRFFTANEEERGARVLVLGADLAAELFKDGQTLGKYVRFKGTMFQVIGVTTKKGASLFGDYDKRAYAPLKVVQQEISGVKHLSFARLKYGATVNSDVLILQIESLLRHRHQISDPAKDDFMVRDSAQGVEILSGVTGSINAFLMVIVLIALLVGGIGIMNIMLVSVVERVREIGLRKAVGASNGTILTQFLVESGFLALFGGVIGLVFGVIFSALTAFIVQSFGYNWQLLIGVPDAFLALGLAAGIGLLAGLYPAISASQLAPTEALRSQ